MAPARAPARTSTRRSSSTSRTVEPSVAGPAPAAGPRRCCGDAAATPSGADFPPPDGRRRWPRLIRRVSGPARPAHEATTVSTGSVAIAAITSCTNTSNPTVMVGAGLLARNAVARGPAASGRPSRRASRPGRARSPSTSRGAGLLAAARAARLRRRRLRLHDVHRQQRAARRAGRRGHRGATTSSSRRSCRATATSRAASIPLVRASLPRLAAARRRLRARRPRRHRPDDRAARHAARDGEPVFLADIWPRPEEVRSDHRRGRLAGPLPRAPTRASSRATSAGARCPIPAGAPLRLGRGIDLHRAAAVLRRPRRASRRRSRTSSARARWRCSATRSPPTTSHRPASIPAWSPAGAVAPGARRHAPSSSTATAPGAATTRS